MKSNQLLGNQLLGKVEQKAERQLHLRSFKTPPSGAVMSDEDDADCAFSMRKGVNRRFYISQTSKAGLLNITKEVYQWQSNSCQSTFKDARPFGSAFRMCNGVQIYMCKEHI